MKLAAEWALYRRVRWVICIVLIAIAVVPMAVHLIGRAEATAKVRGHQGQTDPGRSPASLPITAPGRIQPMDGIVTLAAPATSFGAAVVADLRVNEGERVERDQVLAVLQSRVEVEMDVAAGERRVDVAEAKLAALRSGGKRADIEALQAELQSEEANLTQIAAETNRAVQLHAEQVLSSAALEAQQARLSIATRTVAAKRARLEGLSSVRPADVAVAIAELAAAKADVETARAKLASQFVRAPAAGHVLQIHAYPGQAIGDDGLISFGRTSEMFIDAEIMEHDIARVRVGQPARITGDSLARPLQGRVERIGMLVGPRAVFEIDPTAFADSRIVHVLIRVDNPSAVEHLINARVTVRIEPVTEIDS